MLVFLISLVVLVLLGVSALSVLLVLSVVLPLPARSSHPHSPKHVCLAQHDDYQEHQRQNYSQDVFGDVIVRLVLPSS